MQNSQIRKKGCFLTLTRILDCKAPGLPASSTSELAREGNALNSTCFDLDEAFDTASHTITMAKSTETYMATRTTQELSRLDRKTLDTSTSVMKKRTARNSIQSVLKINLEIIHTVIIKLAHNINLGGVKRANEGKPTDLVKLTER